MLAKVSCYIYHCVHCYAESASGSDSSVFEAWPDAMILCFVGKAYSSIIIPIPP